MQLLSALAILSAAVLPSVVQAAQVKVTYDYLYNDPKWPLDKTACSDGPNGLGSKWPTLGAIPGYPAVGGVPGIAWNSPLCGTCWKLTYVDSANVAHDLEITAVDAAGTFNIAETAFANWAGADGVAAGSVLATAVQVPCCKN